LRVTNRNILANSSIDLTGPPSRPERKFLVFSSLCSMKLKPELHFVLLLCLFDRPKNGDKWRFVAAGSLNRTILWNLWARRLKFNLTFVRFYRRSNRRRKAATRRHIHINVLLHELFLRREHLSHLCHIDIAREYIYILKYVQKSLPHVAHTYAHTNTHTHTHTRATQSITDAIFLPLSFSEKKTLLLSRHSFGFWRKDIAAHWFFSLFVLLQSRLHTYTAYM